MKTYAPILTIIFLLLLTACHNIKPESLYGKWNYVKVSGSPANPTDSVPAIQLKIQTPYILFTRQDSLFIYWGGKILSRGVFKLDGRNIRYKETLADGKTREFPFYVSTLTDKDLVFSTKGADGAEVTAFKQ